MMIILKLIFLTLAVAYSFSNLARVYYKNQIYGSHVLLMTLGIVGFVSIQFDLWK